MRCKFPNTEVIFNAIIAGLFNEKRVPPGSIIDAGALTGEWACWYAGLDRTRTVHGLDPLKFNVQRAESMYGAGAPNLRMHVGGLGDRPSVYDPGARKHRGQMTLSQRAVKQNGTYPSTNTSFTIYTLDGLFAPEGLFGNEQLGFAHIDVEGFELRVIRGAAAVLLRDRPLITFEAHVHQNISYTRELLSVLAASGYDTYLVEEPCGIRADCRNFIGFPRSRQKEFAGSYTLMHAFASLTLQRASVENIDKLAFPCCAPGAACCTPKTGCCKFHVIHAWLRQQTDPPPFSRRNWIEPLPPFY